MDQRQRLPVTKARRYNFHEREERSDIDFDDRLGFHSGGTLDTWGLRNGYLELQTYLRGDAFRSNEGRHQEVGSRLDKVFGRHGGHNERMGT